MNKKLQDLFDAIVTDGKAYIYAMDTLKKKSASRLQLMQLAWKAGVGNEVIALRQEGDGPSSEFNWLKTQVVAFYLTKLKELDPPAMTQGCVYQHIIASLKMAPKDFLQAFKERRNRPPYSPRDKARLVIDTFKARIRSASTTPPTEETLARVFDWIMENAPEPEQDQGTQELYELLVEDETCRNHLWNDHTPQETEEPEMDKTIHAPEINAPAFETKNFVFGSDVKSMNEAQLYDALSRVKAEINNLTELNKGVSSERIKAQVEKLKAAQKEIVALIDQLPE